MGSLSGLNYWLAIPFRGLIQLYKATLSIHFGNACRFHPSCSSYADEALAKHGFWPGIYLTISRIVRCRPWGKSGYDPVPPKVESTPQQSWMRKITGH